MWYIHIFNADGGNWYCATTACLFSRFSLYCCCCCCYDYFNSISLAVYATLFHQCHAFMCESFIHVVYFQFLVAFLGLSVAFIQLRAVVDSHHTWFVHFRCHFLFRCFVFIWCVCVCELFKYCCRRWFDSCPVWFEHFFVFLFSFGSIRALFFPR